MQLLQSAASHLLSGITGWVCQLSDPRLHSSPDLHKALYQMKLFFILFQCLVAASDQIVNSLAEMPRAAATSLRGKIVEHHVLIYLTLMFSQKFAVKSYSNVCSNIFSIAITLVIIHEKAQGVKHFS